MGHNANIWQLNGKTALEWECSAEDVETIDALLSDEHCDTPKQSNLLP